MYVSELDECNDEQQIQFFTFFKAGTFYNKQFNSSPFPSVQMMRNKFYE